MSGFDDGDPMFEALQPLPMGRIDPRKPQGKKALRPELDPHSGNVYYQWFSYMKAYPAYRNLIAETAVQFRLDEDRFTKRLFSWAMRPSAAEMQFDIQATEPFADWWERKGDDLFYDWYEETSHAVEIDCRKGFHECDNGVCVYLPLDGNLPDLINEIEQIFHSRRRSKDELNKEMSRKFSLHQERYTVAALHNMLIIYHAVVEKLDAVRKGQVHLYDIFFEIGPQLIMRRSLRDIDNDTASRRIGSRFEQACCLLFNAGQGRFPDFSRPKINDKEKTLALYEPREIFRMV